MANQTGIAITIKAWLPVTGPISEQIAKLQLVENAHASGDYAELLKASTVEDVKAEQKTRRMDDAPQAAQPAEVERTEVQGDKTEDKPKTEDNGLDGIVPQTEALKAQAAKNKAA